VGARRRERGEVFRAGCGGELNVNFHGSKNQPPETGGRRATSSPRANLASGAAYWQLRARRTLAGGGQAGEFLQERGPEAIGVERRRGGEFHGVAAGDVFELCEKEDAHGG